MVTDPCGKKYSQPHNIVIPKTGNCALEDVLRDREHKKQKQSARYPNGFKKNSIEYKKRKLKGHKNNLSKKKNRLDKISRSIQLVFPLKDSHGILFPYCSYPSHQGIIGEDRFMNNGKKCFDCQYLMFFRPSKKRYSP